MWGRWVHMEMDISTVVGFSSEVLEVEKLGSMVHTRSFGNFFMELDYCLIEEKTAMQDEKYKYDRALCKLLGQISNLYCHCF